MAALTDRLPSLFAALFLAVVGCAPPGDQLDRAAVVEDDESHSAPRPATNGDAAEGAAGERRGDCDVIAVDMPTRYAQDAAQCMPTAAAMAATALGVPQTPRDLARRVRLHPDGAHFFDIEEALRDLGLSAATTVASLEHVAAAMNRGLVPILAVRRGADRHVLVLTRIELCAGDARPTVTWIDPIDGHDHRAASIELQATRSADQVLFVGPGDRAIFDGWPLDGAAELRAAHARFRAETLYRRAVAHGDHGDQAMRLVLRASTEDPCWMPPRDWMHTHRPDNAHQLTACPGY